MMKLETEMRNQTNQPAAWIPWMGLACGVAGLLLASPGLLLASPESIMGWCSLPVGLMALALNVWLLLRKPNQHPTA